MKKLVILLFTFVFMFVFAGCGSDETDTKITVNFDSLGGSEVASIELTTETIGDFKLPTEPTKNGFTFKGWFTDSELKVEFTTLEAKAGTITLYAKWEEVKSDEDQKSEGVMTYAEYDAAAMDSAVVIEAYVQAKQSWWDNKATVYAQDKDGAYFLYNMACTEENYAKLVVGTKIKVTGTKAAWSGEIEITDATFEILSGSYIAPAKDVTSLLGTDDLIKSQNQFVSFKGLTVVASEDADGNDVAYLYRYNGSGEEGDDLYFNVSDGTKTYAFTVESYLCDKDTDVYKAVKALNIGDKIDLEGFLYWYNGVNPHITKVTVVTE